MRAIHQELSAGGWGELSLSEQLANIGSEVSRTIHWQEKGDKENKLKAAERALELIDLTVSSKREESKIRELLRLREAFCDLFIGSNVYNISSQALKDYFLFFAVIARGQRFVRVK